MVKSERVTALLLSSQSIRGELKMKDLTRQDVLDRWIKSQGDMTLTPDHPDRKTDKDGCKNGFLELVRRHVVNHPKEKVNR